MDSKQELNIEEQQHIESEYEEIERKAKEMGIDLDPFKEQAVQRANKILKKSKRELQRLQKHAEKCLLELNKEGYIYAVGKIRTIIRQPMSDKELEILYETSVSSLVEMIKEKFKESVDNTEK
jgi:hypothetical protein